MRNWIMLAIGCVGFFVSGAGVGYLIAEKKDKVEYFENDSDIIENKPWYAVEEDDEMINLSRSFINGSVARQIADYKDKIMNDVEDLSPEMFDVDEDDVNDIDGYTEYDVADNNGNKYRHLPNGTLLKIVPPYFITEEEYDETCMDFEKTSLTYWAKDDIVANEADEPIDEWRKVLREDMPEGFETDEIVYIRNVGINTDFEITKRDDSFMEVVVGVSYSSEEGVKPV